MLSQTQPISKSKGTGATRIIGVLLFLSTKCKLSKMREGFYSLLKRIVIAWETAKFCKKIFIFIQLLKVSITLIPSRHLLVGWVGYGGLPYSYFCKRQHFPFPEHCGHFTTIHWYSVFYGNFYKIFHSKWLLPNIWSI